MTDPQYTHLTLVTDRSGSMRRIEADAEGAVNALLDEQRQQPGRMTVTIVEFDTHVETPVDFTPISDVPDYQLKPRGATALFDAVAEAITTTGMRLADLPEDQRPGRVLIAVVTDGQENSSREHTLTDVRKMIADQRLTYSWEFAFLGADDTAWTGKALGIANTTTYAASGAGARGAYDTLSASLTDLRRGGSFAMPANVTPTDT